MQVVKNQETPSATREQSGMDRVIEKTPWQQHKLKIIWAVGLVMAVVMFFIFKPDAGCRIQFTGK